MKIKDCWTYIATMAPPIWGPPFYGHKRVISLSSPSSAPDSTAATQQRGQLLLNLGTEMVREIRGKQHVKPIFAKYLWNILEKMLYIYMFGNAVPHSQRNFNRKPRLEFPWKIVLNWLPSSDFWYKSTWPCCRRYKFGDLLQLAMSQGSWPKVITAGLNHLSDDKPTRSTTANGKQRVDAFKHTPTSRIGMAKYHQISSHVSKSLKHHIETTNKTFQRLSPPYGSFLALV